MQNSENIEDYGAFKNMKELKKDRNKNREDVVLLKSDALKFLLNLVELDIFYFCKLKRVQNAYSWNKGDDSAILPKTVSIKLCELDELEDIFPSPVTPTVIPNGPFQGLFMSCAFI